MQRKTLLAALIATLSGTACQAHAYSVTVVASRPVEEQVIPRMEAIKDVLGNILSTQTATAPLSIRTLKSWQVSLPRTDRRHVSR